MGLTAEGNSLVSWPTWIGVWDSYSSSALQRAVRIAVLINLSSRDTKRGKKELLVVKCMMHHLSSVSGTGASNKRVLLSYQLLGLVLASLHPHSPAPPVCSRAVRTPIPCPSCRPPDLSAPSILSGRRWMHQRLVVLWSSSTSVLEQWTWNTWNSYLSFSLPKHSTGKGCRFHDSKEQGVENQPVLAEPNCCCQEMVCTLPTPALLTRLCQKQGQSHRETHGPTVPSVTLKSARNLWVLLFLDAKQKENKKCQQIGGAPGKGDKDDQRFIRIDLWGKIKGTNYVQLR